jgi:Ca2+-binding RTX toxin-like protein
MAKRSVCEILRKAANVGHVLFGVRQELWRVDIEAREYATMTSIRGTNADDKLCGTDHSDVIFGRGGNDEVFGKGGNDRVFTLDGDDYIRTGPGNNVIFAGGGDDDIETGAGNDVIFAGDGKDIVEAREGNDLIIAGSGDDEVGGGSGRDVIFGGPGNDDLNGGEGKDIMVGGAGNDRIRGGSGDDVIRDGDGGDRIEGREGDDKIFLSADLVTDDVRFRTDDFGDPEEGLDRIFRFDASSPGDDRGDPGGDRLDLTDYNGFGAQILLERFHVGTLVSIDLDGKEPHCDAKPLALIWGVSPNELMDNIDTDGDILI